MAFFIKTTTNYSRSFNFFDSQTKKFGTLFQYNTGIKHHKTHNIMKKFTFTFLLFILTIFVLLGQRGGTYCHDTHQGNHTNQQQFGSMMTLNRGHANNGLRPNTNVGVNHHNHNGHGYNGHHHGQNLPVGCSHGHNCSFGCTTTHYIHLPVQTSTFDSWLYMLSREPNSAVRMSLALGYVEHNWLTTHQIYDILQLFNNESVLLRIAETAYPNTCDPQNYHQLYNCFSNNTCVLHLQNFVVGR